MSKTNRERVLEYLRSISPDRATNSQIREATGISPHQQVFQITQDLVRSESIRGGQMGKEWTFWVDTSSAAHPPAPVQAPRGAVTAPVGGTLSASAFEELAREAMSQHLGLTLVPGSVPGVPKQWDMISSDGSIVGDAKYFTLVGGQRLPPAKFSVIAEHVWLLEKTGASVKFLVFGHDRRVPELWLHRFGNLVSGVRFFFLSDDSTLEQVTGSH